MELERCEMQAVSRNIASLGVHACLKHSTNAKIVGDVTSPVASDYFALKKSLVKFNGSFALQFIFTGIRAHSLEFARIRSFVYISGKACAMHALTAFLLEQRFHTLPG